MAFTKLQRVFKNGFIYFSRNTFLSLASIMIMTISLLLFGGLIFFNTLTATYMKEIKNKVDINVYFTTSADESDIMSLKRSLEALPEVAQVTYTSRDAALIDFRARHANDSLTLQGLDEIGDNPLPAVLNIKAKDPSQYGGVAKFLDSKNALSSSGASIIESVNYYKNKLVIEKLSNIISATERAGFIASIVLVALAIVITFNTIRVAIYAAKDEIGVMKLVGASHMYARGPFVVAGILYGIVASLLALIIMYPITYYLGNITVNFSENFTLVSYYISNLGQIFLIIVGSGILLGGISSYLAVRRYLNV